jgi:DNA-binding MarR family transcriptional regulator
VRYVVSDAYRDKLEKEKAQRTVQLLFKAARLLNERAIARVQERTDARIRVAHTALFPHVDLEGTRLTEIARRLGTTKQAAGQLVDELEELGVLERVADPADARAKLVRFSKKGRRGLLEGLEVLRGIEEEMRAVVGDAKMRAMHEALAAVIAAVETEK